MLLLGNTIYQVDTHTGKKFTLPHILTDDPSIFLDFVQMCADISYCLPISLVLHCEVYSHVGAAAWKYQLPIAIHMENTSTLPDIPYLPKYKMIVSQDNPPENHVCQVITYLSKSKTSPKNKMCAKEKYFTVNFLHLIHKICKMLSAFTNQWHCLHLHSQVLHLPHTNS